MNHLKERIKQLQNEINAQRNPSNVAKHGGFITISEKPIMQQPADVIWKQITIPTKMAIGARNPTKANGNTLTFKVTIKSNQAHWIEVHYDEGQDLYNVKLIHVRGSKRTEPRSCEGVGVEQLNEIIYNYCHNK